ncbi:phenylacetate-CoA ligase [Desulfacinum infernum DSM 9756]|jgi:phenylacetate-CoA ligase|uniref:Phenylacetate-coenzyme A ligase n=1 Tax=Desulfacinum infernum DSM 9756 TaxID=1121391 RepID=A0A1M4SPB8_9BACT|nr:phenylacetate--CoA ligase [Desulfacinum infernum]MBC7360204.1 phenylacetate--CoA ligase [Desulfacinum sp.]SHE34025.1 phenylacetate-CoA ligase [Desulfacinum infernum DSM 9756]
MSVSFMPVRSSLEDLESLQLQGLQWTVSHAYHHSPFYRQRLDAAGVTPEKIRSLDDLRRLPFTTADDLQAGYPFPLRAVPFEKIVRIHASSGTTGKRKVLCYTQKDIDDWAMMFARCFEMAGLTREDRVQIAVGYGLWTAGVGFQLGCERFGAMAVPVGPANTEIHCQMLVDMQSTVFCATASMALLMAEEIERRGLRDKIALKKIIFGAERHSRRMRQRIQDITGAEHIFDIPGLTELYGPGTGLECTAHQGIHYWADYYILEILNPETLEPVAPGELGEMVVTTLRKEAAPLIRYRTRDLTRLLPEPCPCGNPLPRHDHLLGRSDDMFIFRAVNIYPGQIDHVLSQMPGVGSEYQVHLHHREDGRDMMIIRVERARGRSPEGDDELKERIATEIRRQILVRANVDVVDYGSLPRTERKSKRVFDHRIREE